MKEERASLWMEEFFFFFLSRVLAGFFAYIAKKGEGTFGRVFCVFVSTL